MKRVRRCPRPAAGAPSSPDEAPGGPWGYHRDPGGPYLSRAPIRDSRVIRQTLTGPVVPNRGSDGNPTEPQLEPIWPYSPRRALTEDSMDPYWCTK